MKRLNPGIGRAISAAIEACTCLFTLTAISTPVRAQTVALTFSNDGGYTNGYIGTLGWEFTAISTENLTGFGFYNNGGTITASHEVGLWDSSGNLLDFGTVGPTTADNTIGYFDYSPTTPYQLQAGDSYIVGALLTSDDYFYYDPSSIATDPSISYVQNQFDANDAAALTFPQSSDAADYGFGFFGPNFEVAAIQGPTSTPEPGSIALLVSMAMPGLLRSVRWRRVTT